MCFSLFLFQNRFFQKDKLYLHFYILYDIIKLFYYLYKKLIGFDMVLFWNCGINEIVEKIYCYLSFNVFLDHVKLFFIFYFVVWNYIFVHISKSICLWLNLLRGCWWFSSKPLVIVISSALKWIYNLRVVQKQLSKVCEITLL